MFKPPPPQSGNVYPQPQTLEPDEVIFELIEYVFNRQRISEVMAYRV